MNRLRHEIRGRAVRLGLCSIAVLALGTAAYPQFKEIGPPPYPPATARQKIRTLIEKADPSTPQPTIDALFRLAPWYRDIVDEELIAAWHQQDARASLTQILEPLADARVASAIVEFSWRQQSKAI